MTSRFYTENCWPPSWVSSTQRGFQAPVRSAEYCRRCIAEATMLTLVLITACSFITCLLLTPLIRDVFRVMGVVDRPGEPRKIHTQAIPRVGGIPIAISYLLAYTVLLLLPVEEQKLLERHLPLVWKLIPAAGLVFITGLV